MGADAEDAATWSTRELERVVYKICTGCHRWKLRTEFHVMRSMYDGRYPAAKSAGGTSAYVSSGDVSPTTEQRRPP
jgi:hypothetical protein